MMPPQFANQAAYQHIRHQTPSASPPISNGVPFHHGQRQHTPQPQVLSRPSSRNAPRRSSSNLGGHQALPQGQQPVVNGQYAYMPQPPIYQPPHGPVIPGHPQQHPGPQQQPPSFQYPGPPQPHAQLQQVYMEERRSSMPPAFPQQERHPSHPASTPPQPQHQQIPTQPQMKFEPPQPQLQQQQQSQQQDLQQQQAQQQQMPQQQMLEPVKRMSVNKSRSIFTPIDESRSILSQHWASSTSAAESSRGETATSNRSHSVDVGAVSRNNGSGPSPPPVPPRANTHNKIRNTSMSSIPDSFTPPSRTNSGLIAGKPRPRLALQIPDEPSDGGSQTGDSSPRESTDATGVHPSRRGGTEGSHSSSVVLPPPSPSERSILSAGASGPPNPFARPHPPSQASQGNAIDTPVSALPSRFMSNEFLPSPSSFYPDWNYRGSDSNTLPSPLNFATPIIPSGPSFLREDSGPSNQKRKTPDADESGDAKRSKHE